MLFKDKSMHLFMQEKVNGIEKDCRLDEIILKMKKFVLPLFFIIVSVWTLPWPVILPSAGLDPSWIVGIHWAFLENLRFGEDILLNFGPLVFLWYPYLIDYNLWSLSLFFSLFIHFLFIGSIFLLLKKFSAKGYHYIALIPILVFANPSLDYKSVIISLIFLYNFLNSNSKLIWKNIGVLTFVGLLLSITSLIKFHIFMMSILTILLFTIASMLTKRSWWDCIYLLSIYFISLIFVWSLAGQSVSNFVPFLYNALELSSEYNSAMAIEGPHWQIFVGVITILAVLFLLIYSTVKKKEKSFIFILLNLGILFVTFKHGFVRHDLHVLVFFQVYLIFLYLLLIISSQEFDVKMRINKIKEYLPIVINGTIIIILLISQCYTTPWILNDNIMIKQSSYKHSISYIANPNLFDENIRTIKEKIKKDYPLDPQTIEFIDNKTVDIFPWDIALCWAYNFNWSPRPMIQSLTAYTQHIDKINSQHFMGDNSPQAILYAYKSIDGRYPLFDEPATFRTILCNYTYVNKSGGFLLLTHNPKAGNCGFEENRGTIKSEIGQAIPIPEYEEGYVFGYIELDYSFVGKIMKIIYKPSPVYIQFKFKGDRYSQKFRFIPDTAKNGVFLSQYVGNLDDLAPIFQGQIMNDIEGIVIVTDKPSHYSKHVKVKFVSVPANVSVKRGYRLVHLFKPIRILPQQPFVSGVGIINGGSRPIIYEHPLPSDKSLISFENISVPKNASLKFSIALDPQVWSPDKGDGVTFEICVKENGTEKLLFSKYIDPKHNPAERKWNDFEVDLSEYAGKNIKLIFSTLPGPNNDTSWDWAWWGEPMIVGGQR